MQPPAENRDYKTAAELAARAGVSISTIRRLKAAGKIVFFQPGGKGHLVKFPPDAFKQLTDEQSTASDDAESLNPQQVQNIKDAREQESDRPIGNLRSTDSNGKQSRLSGPTPKWMRK